MCRDQSATRISSTTRHHPLLDHIAQILDQRQELCERSLDSYFQRRAQDLRNTTIDYLGQIQNDIDSILDNIHFALERI